MVTKITFPEIGLQYMKFLRNSFYFAKQIYHTKFLILIFALLQLKLEKANIKLIFFFPIQNSIYLSNDFAFFSALLVQANFFYVPFSYLNSAHFPGFLRGFFHFLFKIYSEILSFQTFFLPFTFLV